MRIRVRVAKSEPDHIVQELIRRGIELDLDPKNGIDYVFHNDCNLRAVFVERKEVSDLLHSFIGAAASGESRLMNQVRRMAARAAPYDLCILLLEGHLGARDGFATVGRRKSGVPYDAIDNWLMHLQGMGVRIIHSPTSRHTPARLLSVAKNWLGNTESTAIVRLPKAPTPQLRTLMTFPGIGAKRAKQMLDRFGSLGIALYQMERGEPELGAKRELKIREYLTEGV